METKNEQLADTLTIGQYRVGSTFNPGGHALVDEIKRKSAELIDLCERMKQNETPNAATAPEVGRLIALAQTHFEDGAMWAVKAATKPAR